MLEAKKDTDFSADVCIVVLFYGPSPPCDLPDLSCLYVAKPNTDTGDPVPL